MPVLKDSPARYGLVSVALHWSVAVTVIGLFALGIWMVDLSYYDPWYKQGPDLHRAIGVCLFLAMLIRGIWRLINTAPPPEPAIPLMQQRLAKGAHHLLYVLLFGVMLCGYLISTADGRAVSVFGLIEVPALISGLPNQADIAGNVHRWMAYALIVLAMGHAAAALKHHFIDRDRTLKKMLGLSS